MSKKLIDIVVNALEDIKGKDIVTMDVSDLTDVMDQIVVASGTSSRQVKSLADNVVEDAKKAAFNRSVSKEWTPLNGCWWILAISWYTSCFPRPVCFTSWKNSGPFAQVGQESAARNKVRCD